MSQSSQQKLKLLFLLQILQEKSDPLHPISMADLIQELSLKGIDAERKGIYRDLATLKEAGYCIVSIKGSSAGYYLDSQGLNIDEVSMLIDAVQANRFLSEQSVATLSRKLKSLVSTHEQSQLKRSLEVPGRANKTGEEIFSHLNLLHGAIAEKKKLQFQYFRYNNELKREARHNGAPYIVSPLQIGFVEGFYYLMAWSDTHNQTVRFRVDRMDQIRILEENRPKNALIASQSLQDFSNQAFGMFDGEVQNVHLIVAPGAMDIMVDRFGAELRCYPKEDGTAQVNVTVRVSPQFFGWIAGVSPKIKITGPKLIKAQYQAWLEGLLKDAQQE